MAVLIPIAMTVWMVADGGFYGGIPESLRRTAWVPLSDFALANADVRPATMGRSRVLTGCVSIALGAIGWIAFGLLVGSSSFRSTRNALGLTAVIAYWLFLGRQCESIVEFGRVYRLASKVHQLEPFAIEVDRHWSELCETRSVCSSQINFSNMLAYPVEQPTMCFFASTHRIDSCHIEIASIERTAGEAIRLQLTGEHRGYWIEKRTNSQLPQPFRSGLDYSMYPISIKDLGRSFYLVRYRD